ncbi:MAG: alpha/beta fold hydrolase, partial [Nocardioidaceae bacterium]
VRDIGHLLSPITRALPIGRITATALRHSGFMFPSADPAVVRRAVREFLTTDVDWYFHLAVAAARHERVSLRGIGVPTAFVAGRWDVLADNKDIRSASERIAEATCSVLPGSHFLQVEHPEQVHEELLTLVRRVAARARARPTARSRREVS